MKTIAELSQSLRAALKRSGMTQEALRQAAGLSRQTAVNVFKGSEDFKLSTLLAVADKLGLELVLLPRQAARGEALGVGEPVVETLVQRALGPGQPARPGEGPGAATTRAVPPRGGS